MVRTAGLLVLASLLWALAAAAEPLADGVPPPDSQPVLQGASPDLVEASVADPIAALPPAVRTRSLLEEAWQTPDLAARVERTRRTSLELGVWSLDAAARALTVGDHRSSELELAEAAVALAPDLPAAHMRLAAAKWLQGGSPMAALRSAIAGVAAIGRHLEAMLWFAGSGLYLLATALVVGGLLAVLMAGVVSLPHAAHDLGHAASSSAPAFAGGAALAALLLVPLALGEGLLGLALALGGVAGVYGTGRRRWALALAVAGIGIGAFPVARYAGTALAALSDDPVGQAAYSVAQGLATPVELARLRAADGRDPLASRALAIHARRLGNLSEADARYQSLLDAGRSDVAALNNAANVRLELGHIERALELYDRALSRQELPVVLFNMAQAHGRAFQVEDLNRNLERAQQTGGPLMAQLAALQGDDDASGFVVALPLPASLFWSRLLESPAGENVAADFRAAFAPGRLGSEPAVLAGVAVGMLLLAGGIRSRTVPSRWCRRCGERVCPRCDPQGTAGELCEGCHKLFFEPEKTDRVLRTQRVAELRRREQWVNRWAALVSVLVPGAAGLLADRPLRCWLGALSFALAAAASLWHDGVVPDPLVAGAAAPLVFIGVAALASAAYALVVWASLATRRQAS